MGIDLQLKHVCVVGVYGWNSIFETVVGQWLEDISHNQVLEHLLEVFHLKLLWFFPNEMRCLYPICPLLWCGFFERLEYHQRPELLLYYYVNRRGALSFVGKDTGRFVGLRLEVLRSR
ncbi:hypothetical protein J5N97_024585 [Dioscorea zingiberensis]|uniref:Autophagy-related protein 2 n=1 Tax=Dioscorea zingiberensis TaxID=325984 RepID=A0A9D5H968_9LILI|nr:hypothetical protein J5N97_024585 [Dioscorea zingiberensis]